jgi:hypothetical protein
MRIFPALQRPEAPTDMASLARSATVQLSSLARLLNAGEADVVLSEDAVIRLVPLAVGPFFAQGGAADEAGARGQGKGKQRSSDTATKGKEGLKEIRLEALGVLRAVSRQAINCCPLSRADFDLLSGPTPDRFFAATRASGRGSSRRS